MPAALVVKRWLSELDAVLGRPMLKRSINAAIGEVAQPNIRATDRCTPRSVSDTSILAGVLLAKESKKVMPRYQQLRK